MDELQTMDALKHTLQTQNQQGEALLQIIVRMEEQEKRMDKKVGEVRHLVDEVSKKVHLDDGEATAIQKKVGEKATEFAKKYFSERGYEPTQNLFLSKQGQMRGNIYRRLKKHFNVVKYTSIKHMDFNNAVIFIKSLEYDQLTTAELRHTQKQLELLELERPKYVMF